MGVKRAMATTLNITTEVTEAVVETTTTEVVVSNGPLSTIAVPEGDFVALEDQDTSTVVESNSLTISGDSNWVWPVLVRGGDGQVQINSQSWAPDGLVRAGDSLKLRVTTSPTTRGSVTVHLYGQGFTKPWNVTTFGLPFFIPYG